MRRPLVGGKRPSSSSTTSSSSRRNSKYRSSQRQRQQCLLLGALLLVLVGFVTYRTLHHHVMTTATTDNKNPLRQSSSLSSNTKDLITALQAKMTTLDHKVRAMKQSGVIMETDPASLKATKALQDVTLQLLLAKYGDYRGTKGGYRIVWELEFPPTIADYETLGKDGVIVIELAPVDLIPVSTYTFLEIARTWQHGAFHRNAGHVLQATAQASAVQQSLPFQEYSSDFPHVKGTCGYCGRPSGPCFYISIMDNTKNHGPGSQQQANPYEADANFGKVIQGMDDVVPRIHSTKGTGWLPKDQQIAITKMTILVPSGPNGTFEEWKPNNT